MSTEESGFGQPPTVTRDALSDELPLLELPLPDELDPLELLPLELLPLDELEPLLLELLDDELSPLPSLLLNGESVSAELSSPPDELPSLPGPPPPPELSLPPLSLPLLSLSLLSELLLSLLLDSLDELDSPLPLPLSLPLVPLDPLSEGFDALDSLWLWLLSFSLLLLNGSSLGNELSLMLDEPGGTGMLPDSPLLLPLPLDSLPLLLSELLSLDELSLDDELELLSGSSLGKLEYEDD